MFFHDVQDSFRDSKDSLYFPELYPHLVIPIGVATMLPTFPDYLSDFCILFRLPEAMDSAIISATVHFKKPENDCYLILFAVEKNEVILDC